MLHFPPAVSSQQLWHSLLPDAKNSGTKCIIINNKYNLNNLFNGFIRHLNCCSTSSKHIIMSWMKLETITIEDIRRTHTNGKFTQLHKVVVLLSRSPSISRMPPSFPPARGADFTGSGRQSLHWEGGPIQGLAKEAKRAAWTHSWGCAITVIAWASFDHPPLTLWATLFWAKSILPNQSKAM